MATSPVRLGVIGCGGMARYHVKTILQQPGPAQVIAVCEPSPEAYAATARIFQQVNLDPPPNQPDWRCFLDEWHERLDAVLIATPHVYHHDQAQASLDAELDVLLEKPMVMTAAEARSLIETRNRTGRQLVVAFNGSLSPRIRTAVNMLRSGELGSILTINAKVWPNWGAATEGTWRQDMTLSGGGFLFDTGAHMLNTVSDLAGENFVEVAAWVDNQSRPVDILAAVMGRLESGALVTMNACGDAIPSCHSDIRVFCTQAILRTGIWGEHLEVQRDGRRRLTKVPVPPSMGVCEQFLAVRSGQIPNPSPPEIGLRMALLWDAIKASVARGGAPVKCADFIE